MQNDVHVYWTLSTIYCYCFWCTVISFQEDDVENNTQSFEYSDEMENSATMCGKQKEPGSDCTELRALLLF